MRANRMLIAHLFVPVDKLFDARLVRISSFLCWELQRNIQWKEKWKGLMCSPSVGRGPIKVTGKPSLLAEIPLASGTTYVANTLLSLCSALLRAPTLVHGTDVRTKRIFKVHPPVSGCDQTWLVKLTGICTKLVNASARLQSWFGNRPAQMTPGLGLLGEGSQVHWCYFWARVCSLKISQFPKQMRKCIGIDIFHLLLRDYYIIFLCLLLEN